MKGKYDYIEINQFIRLSTGLRPCNLIDDMQDHPIHTHIRMKLPEAVSFGSKKTRASKTNKKKKKESPLNLATRTALYSQALGLESSHDFPFRMAQEDGSL